MARITENQEKGTTLLDTTQELEREVGNLMRLLNIDYPPHPVLRQIIDEPEGIAEQRVIEVVSRLETLKCRVAESAGLVERLIRVIGE